MPIDPMTGQANYNEDVALPFRMAENYPSISSMIAFNQRRGANTLLKGGFLDTNRTTGRFFARNDSLQRFKGLNTYTSLDAGNRFRGGSYAGPLNYRKRKIAKMQAKQAANLIPRSQYARISKCS